MNTRYILILSMLLIAANVYPGGADVYVSADGQAIILLGKPVLRGKNHKLKKKKNKAEKNGINQLALKKTKNNNKDK